MKKAARGSIAPHTEWQKYHKFNTTICCLKPREYMQFSLPVTKVNVAVLDSSHHALSGAYDPHMRSRTSAKATCNPSAARINVTKKVHITRIRRFNLDQKPSQVLKNPMHEEMTSSNVTDKQQNCQKTTISDNLLQKMNLIGSSRS
jgi:hypothetical protein